MPRNVALFLLAEFLRSVHFVYAVATLFYIEIGINYTQLSILWLAMAVVQVALEVPLGVVSDRVGHKVTILAGYAAFGAAMVLIGSGTNIWLPLLGGAMWGVSGALLSGATDAFLYESLVEAGRADDYLRLKGRHAAMTSLGIIVGAIPGAYMFTLDIRTPWFALAASTALALVLFAFARNPPIALDDEEHPTHWRQFRSGLSHLLSHRALLWLTLVTTLSTFPMFGLSMIRQPYLVEREVSIEALGYVFVGIEVIGMGVSMVAHRIEKVLGLSLSVFVMIALLVGLYAAMAHIHVPWAILPLAALFATFRFSRIVLGAHSNRHIPSARRATILSIQSMGSSVLLIVFMLSSGIVLDALAIDRYLVIVSGYVVVCILPLWLVRRRFNIGGERFDDAVDVDRAIR